MKSKAKTVKIVIDYSDFMDLEASFMRIKSQIYSGKTQGETKEFTFHHLSTKLAENEYRIELVNGQMCEVLQSKMNRKIEINK